MVDPRRPFLDMIRAHPDDDGPRLVYADWLDEHGECDRAEFIRASITAEQPYRPFLPLLNRRLVQQGQEVFVAGECSRDLVWNSRVYERMEPPRKRYRAYLSGRDDLQISAFDVDDVGECLYVRSVPDANLSRMLDELAQARIVRDQLVTVFLEPTFRPADKRRAVVEAAKRRVLELLDGPRPDFYRNEIIWFHGGDGTEDWKFTFKPTWRRGFVEEITADWIDWGGGACRSCGGAGEIASQGRRFACRSCNKSGRVEGQAGALLEQHPIRKVNLRMSRESFEQVTDFRHQLVTKWPGIDFEMPLLPDRGRLMILPAGWDVAQFQPGSVVLNGIQSIQGAQPGTFDVIADFTFLPDR